MLRPTAIVASAAIVAVAGGLWYANSGPADPFADCRSSAIAGGADTIGGPFELINAKGETVTDADVITEPSILYFGYTYCPDVCPLDFSRNAEAVDLLQEQGTSVTPVFISIDPERDTPEVVGDFAYNMHERAIGLTGSEAQVKAASRTYRTYFKKQDSEDEYYLVDHSTFSYLVLPDIGFVEYFRRDVTPDQMAETVQCYVGAAGQG